ncbi:MAG TPA: phosphate ABC transporter permease PstA [Candidatus Bathyarchaeia archaeon]|nr:phosphate ABC transporter permease PstA [Candidatus Bathyarchaeia archaeon]
MPELLSFERRRRFSNRLYLTLSTICFLVALLPLFSILYQTLLQGASALSFEFFTQVTPPIGGSGGGILNALEGSIVMVGIGSLIGIPVGVLGGAYLAEYPGKVSYYIRLISEVLTGVPSIVTGIFVYELIVATQHRFSALTGGIALGFMMIPIVAISTHEALKLVSSAIREGGLALGISRAKTLVYILLSSARGGVITGIALAVARIMGETAPLLFTSLGSQFMMTSINDPAASLTLIIYNFGTSPYTNAHVQAWGAALILLLIVLGLNIVVRTASRLKVKGND